MTVKNLVLKTKELANETKKYIERYNAESKRVNEELENNRMLPSDAREYLNGFKKHVETELGKLRSSIYAGLDEAKTKEMARIEQKEESMTHDIMAELTMIEKTYQKGEDLSKYVRKYENNPLALRRLNDIVTSNGGMLEIPEAKGTKLDKLINEISEQVRYLTDVELNKTATTYRFGGVTLNIKHDGVINSLDRALYEYENDVIEE
ncbi:hypothetical protein [Macrococcus capreoli]|uniref:hypothetical protein n=1 Tax=Macrococcus capreoli TaxID=2982690 RepID=UPI003F439D04